MRGILFLAVSVGWMGTAGLALAQTTIPVPTVIPGAPATRVEVRARIKAQEARINADSKVGKLTTQQANALLAALQAIKDQKKADYAENGKKELTSDQKAELIGMLDENEKSLTSQNGITNNN